VWHSRVHWCAEALWKRLEALEAGVAFTSTAGSNAFKKLLQESYLVMIR